jgi:hypothetical protein
MISLNLFAGAAAAAALAFLASPASAALTFYSDLPSFGAATGDADGITFPDTPMTIGANPASYEVTTLNYKTVFETDDAISDGLLFLIGAAQTGHVPVLSSQGHDNGSAHLRISVNSPIRAFAIFFGTPDATNVKFEFSNGDSANFASSDAASLYATPHFLGVISDTAFTSLLITAPDTAGFNHLNVEGIIVGQAVVPEPATWAMMLLGFGGLGAALRQRRRDSFTLLG